MVRQTGAPVCGGASDSSSTAGAATKVTAHRDDAHRDRAQRSTTPTETAPNETEPNEARRPQDRAPRSTTPNEARRPQDRAPRSTTPTETTPTETTPTETTPTRQGPTRRRPQDRAQRDDAHSAVADGPRAGLQPLKWEPGAERPAFAGLPEGASSAGALDEEDVGAHTRQQDKSLSVTWSSIAAVEDLPTVAPATGDPADSPAQAGRSVPGSHFSGCRPARGPSATAEWASSRWALSCGRRLVGPCLVGVVSVGVVSVGVVLRWALPCGRCFGVDEATAQASLWGSGAPLTVDSDRVHCRR